MEGRTETYMLVKILEAAVCMIANSPALLDFPSSSFDAAPVLGSVGGKIEIPASAKNSSARSSRPRAERTSRLTVPNFLPSHQTDIDAPGTGDSRERNKFRKQKFCSGGESAKPRNEGSETNGDGARGESCRYVSWHRERVRI